jgi:hypothetical protein
MRRAPGRSEPTTNTFDVIVIVIVGVRVIASLNVAALVPRW